MLKTDEFRLHAVGTCQRVLKLHTGPHVVSAIGLHMFLLYYYLNREGYIFIGVTLFVSQIVEMVRYSRV